MSHPGKKKPASPGDKFYFIHDPWQMDVLLLAHQLEGSVLMSSSWRWLLYVYDIGLSATWLRDRYITVMPALNRKIQAAESDPAFTA